MPIQIGQRADHGFDEPLGLLSDCHRRIEHFLRVLSTISADAAGFPRWKEPIKTHFRRTAQGWQLVGLERLPEKVEPALTLQARS